MGGAAMSKSLEHRLADERPKITERTARALASSLINCPDGGSWVDELDGTETDLTEWLLQWFNNKEFFKGEAEHRLACPLVEKWRKQVRAVKGSQDQWWIGMESAADELEQFWRERVEPLIEAGQAMHEAIVGGYTDEADKASDTWAALAKVKEP